LIWSINPTMTGPDYIVDIDGLKAPDGSGRDADAASFRGRPWLAVHWRCCGVYSRVYRNKAGTLYEGRCPKCGRPVTARVGPGGTSHRFFEAQ
jgi:hypothetical protein